MTCGTKRCNQVGSTCRSCAGRSQGNKNTSSRSKTIFAQIRSLISSIGEFVYHRICLTQVQIHLLFSFHFLQEANSDKLTMINFRISNRAPLIVVALLLCPSLVKKAFAQEKVAANPAQQECRVEAVEYQ